MLEINSMRYAHDNCFYITKVLVFSIKFISNNNIHTPFMNKHIIYTDTYICIYVNVCVESSNLAVNLKRFYRQRKSNDISYTYVHTYIHTYVLYVGASIPPQSCATTLADDRWSVTLFLLILIHTIYVGSPIITCLNM